MFADKIGQAVEKALDTVKSYVNSIRWRHIPEVTEKSKPAYVSHGPLLKETHDCVGLYYRRENTEKLAARNPLYVLNKSGLKVKGVLGPVYRFTYPVKSFGLEPEPTNAYDRNAVKVMADGLHVGYIRAESCEHVKELIAQDRVVRVEGELTGGQCKGYMLNPDGVYEYCTGYKPLALRLDIYYEKETPAEV